VLHIKDKAVLEQIKYVLGVGGISLQGTNSIQYKVTSVEDLAVLINHLNKFPLIFQKLGDFILFKEAFKIINTKSHLTQDG
jgi:hypothetical protein